MFTLSTLSFIALVGLASTLKGIFDIGFGSAGGGDDGGVGVGIGGGSVKTQGWWEYLWAGTKLDANGFVTALYNVIW